MSIDVTVNKLRCSIFDYQCVIIRDNSFWRGILSNHQQSKKYGGNGLFAHCSTNWMSLKCYHLDERHMMVVVEGFTLDSQTDTFKLSCAVFCESYQNRLLFPHNSNRSETILNTVHTDICVCRKNFQSVSQDSLYYSMIISVVWLTFISCRKKK